MQWLIMAGTVCVKYKIKHRIFKIKVYIHLAIFFISWKHFMGFTKTDQLNSSPFFVICSYPNYLDFYLDPFHAKI